MKKLLACFFLLMLLTSPSPARADGMVAPHPDFWVSETGQKAVIWFDGDQETLILSTAFQGDAHDFGWIIPIPSRPEVEKGNDEIFTSLADLTEPKYRVQPLGKGANLGTLEAPANQAVTVVETKKVDVYEVSVVTSTESRALAEWFAENGYPYPVSQAYILDEYIEKNWFFVGAKIDTEKLGPLVEGQLRKGHATPLLIRFETKRIVYPLKISSITGVETPAIPLPEEFIPLETSESAIGKKLNLPSLPRPVSDRVNILLYVFDPKKKVEIPGFNTTYAGWVRPKEIADLAFDDEGNSLLPAEKKMYLTKLNRLMSPSEMTADLYPRYAEKNTAVGRGSSLATEPWTVGLIFGLPLLLEIGFIVWLFLRRKK